MVKAWRELRHPRIAALIDRVSARVFEEQRPIRAKSVPERVKAVIAACVIADPVEVGRVLSAEWPGTWQHALPMLEAIISLPDDPRVAGELARQVDLTRYETWTSAAFYRPLFQRLGELGDVRQLPLLEAQLTRNKSHYYQRDMRPLEEDAVAHHRRLVVPALSVDDAQLLEELEAPHAGTAAREKTRHRSAAELLEAVYARPEDLGARAVYGDWLSEHGDPRGDLISLQLGAPSEKSTRRQEALIKKHWKQWLGPLADWFNQPPRFEAGFPVAGRVEDPSYRAGAEGFRALLARREWSTFRSLSRRWWSPAELAMVAAHANFKSLREVAEVRPEMIAALAQTGAPLTRIHITWMQDFSLEPGALKGLARLEHVSFLARQFPLLAPGLGPLKELAMEAEFDLGDEIHATWNRLESMPITQVLLGRFDGAVRLTRRGASGPFTKAQLLSSARMESLLPLLPASLTSVTSEGVPRVAMSKEWLSRFAVMLERFPRLEHSELPFEEQADRPEVPHVTLSMSGVAFFEVPKLAPLWKILTEDFGLRFDVFDARGELELGEEPVEKLSKWVNNKRCRGVRIKVRGTPTELSLVREEGSYTSAELPLGEPDRFFRALEVLIAFARPSSLRLVNGRQMVTIERMSELPSRREELLKALRTDR